MRLRRAALVDGGTTTTVWDAASDRWVPLGPALDRIKTPALEDARDDLIAFLAGGEAAREAASTLCEALDDEDLSATFALSAMLPFEPQLLRAFTCWERHWTQGARGLVRRYLPAAAPPISLFERVTGRTFPPFSPGRLYRQRPSFYIGNHLTIEPPDTTISWPSFCEDLDFELELAAIICRPARDVTGQAALDAIGGFTVLNDLSARDIQWEENRHGIFGPLGKTKSFASVLGHEVVTADEILPDVESLSGRVQVNGETWSRPSLASMQHGYADIVAYASLSEQLHPGEIISSGTPPNGSGLELGRWLKPGDQLTLQIDRVGTNTCQIGERPREDRWEP
jgi:2-keto-4-pentenoate hydratase/2-oxohepta-3-ene-1,7-dioic acid hydratase in catechol pathway